ncbi:phosphotransferase [Paenibacillus tyrfis]|uniref:phosphotransferase n=1 Tax=Paenibacillus tyrfis TaxID=1501230 RepID=UPI00209CC92A|nr:phosphotransferase [Paenibacillus tyrfis]MCP1311947.1 aminoglycoside phosphotransferase family protein [Paenibacillus tyrfis]
MTFKQDIHDILEDLRNKRILDSEVKAAHLMKGTTDGRVYTLTINDEPKYVLKLDSPQNICLVEQCVQAYPESRLLPKLLYIDPAKTFMIYPYLTGTTHNERGCKLDWMTLLVKDLLNHYEIDDQTEKWGRLALPRDSWLEFNERSLEGARENIGRLLPTEDYDKVQALIERISKVETKYLLHGDTGVHNFVFHKFKLTGVIDPSPMAGPVTYDFTYAFCSSPDDLNLDTLFAAFELLHHKSINKSRLVEETIFQLYCRIGISAKVHPKDLDDYLKAWEYWKALLP